MINVKLKKANITNNEGENNAIMVLVNANIAFKISLLTIPSILNFSSIWKIVEFVYTAIDSITHIKNIIITIAWITSNAFNIMLSV